MSSVYPTKESYESALQTVKEYGERQANLKRLASDLSFHLQKFDNFKFKVNKKEGKVLFTGVLKDTSEIKIGESVCSVGDVFADVIGKLIAVKKSIGVSVDDVVEHVEGKGIEFDSKGIYANSISVTGILHPNEIISSVSSVDSCFKLS